MNQQANSYEATYNYVFDFGFSVIPVSRRSKKPMIGWKHLQTRPPTREEIASWHDFNVGIITGKISGIVVVDCESREDAEWFYTTRGKSPTVVQTKRGFHFYFSYPGPTKNAIKCFDRYDIRGDGGYVLAPPSVFTLEDGSIGKYTWKLPLVKDLPAFNPSWLPNKTDKPHVDLERDIHDGTKYISNITAISGNRGHDDTYRAVCRLKDSGLDELSAYAAIFQWNKTNAKPPWSDRELVHKIKCVYHP